VGFAAHIMALYRDETLWRTIRDGALGRLRQENGRDGFVGAINSVLAPSTAIGNDIKMT
jgi:hypothetical protein